MQQRAPSVLYPGMRSLAVVCAMIAALGESGAAARRLDGGRGAARLAPEAVSLLGVVGDELALFEDHEGRAYSVALAGGAPARPLGTLGRTRVDVHGGVVAFVDEAGAGVWTPALGARRLGSARVMPAISDGREIAWVARARRGVGDVDRVEIAPLGSIASAAPPSRVAVDGLRVEPSCLPELHAVGARFVLRACTGDATTRALSVIEPGGAARVLFPAIAEAPFAVDGTRGRVAIVELGLVVVSSLADGAQRTITTAAASDLRFDRGGALLVVVAETERLLRVELDGPDRVARELAPERCGRLVGGAPDGSLVACDPSRNPLEEAGLLLVDVRGAGAASLRTGEPGATGAWDLFTDDSRHVLLPTAGARVHVFSRASSGRWTASVVSQAATPRAIGGARFAAVRLSGDEATGPLVIVDLARAGAPARVVGEAVRGEVAASASRRTLVWISRRAGAPGLHAAALLP